MGAPPGCPLCVACAHPLGQWLIQSLLNPFVDDKTEAPTQRLSKLPYLFSRETDSFLGLGRGPRKALSSPKLAQSWP